MSLRNRSFQWSPAWSQHRLPSAKWKLVGLQSSELCQSGLCTFWHGWKQDSRPAVFCVAFKPQWAEGWLSASRPVRRLLRSEGIPSELQHSWLTSVAPYGHHCDTALNSDFWVPSALQIQRGECGWLFKRRLESVGARDWSCSVLR